MALAETAQLVAKLSLDDRAFKQGVSRANRSIGTLGRSARRVGGAVGKSIAAGAAVAAGVIAVNVKSGIESLATLESAVTSVDGAIAQMGLTGQLTGSQIAGWANEIEASVQAAFDDKEIAAATTALIRYGNVAPENLRRTMVVMTDLAAKTGSVEAASNLLARALADPAKGMTRLTRAGIILTKAEQKRITQLTKAGKTAKAQAYLLSIIEKRTKGAAAAMNGPWNDALKTLGDTVEDAQRALAIGLMPVLQRTSEWLNRLLKDHEGDIRAFGQQLAGAFDKLLTFVQGIDWKRVGDGLKMAADFAGKLIGAFTSLPPEAQATIIALAGLNKLSGGAVTGAVGGLVETVGKIIGKGLQTIFAANVTVIGKSVTDMPGGTPSVSKPGQPGGMNRAAKVGGAAAVAVALATGVKGDTPNDAAAQRVQTDRIVEALRRAVAEGRGNDLAAGGKETNAQMLGRLLKEAQRTNAQLPALPRMADVSARATQATIKAEQSKALVAFRAGERASLAGNRLAGIANNKLDAIRAKKQSVVVNTRVQVSQAVSVASATQHARYRQAVARSATVRTVS